MRITLFLTLSILFGSTAFAGEKICYGNAGTNAAGQALAIEFTASQLILKPLTTGADKGTFPYLNDEPVLGTDGKTYVKFDGGYENSAGECLVIYLVDQELLASGTTGELRADCGGDHLSFVCRDQKNLADRQP